MSHTPSPSGDLIDHYTRSPSWDEAQQILKLHPELFSDAPIVILENLIAEARSRAEQYTVEFYEENLAFLIRCRNGTADTSVGSEKQSDNEEVEAELQDLFKQANSKAKSFETDGGVEAAMAVWEAVISYPSFSASPNRFQEKVFFTAGVYLYQCYRKVGNLGDLRRAVDLWEQGLRISPLKSRTRVRLLSNSGKALSELYDQTDNQEHLLGAIAFYNQALVHYLAPDLELIPDSLASLGDCLRARFRFTKSSDDLRKMLDAFQQAVDKTPRDSPGLGDRVDDLARAFRIKHSLTKEVSDIETALDLYRQAVQLGGLEPYVVSLNIEGQARCSFILYEERGEISYLNQAIDLYRESATCTVEPEGKSLCLQQLAHCFDVRYRLNRQAADMKSFVSAIKEAIELGLEDDRMALYESLGDGFYNLHTQYGESGSLSDAVEAWREALRLIQTPSVDLARLLESLISALTERYQHSGAAEDLELIAQYKQSFFSLAPELKEETLSNLIGSLIKSSTSDEARHLIALHSVLLDPAADQILASMMESAQSQGKTVVAQALANFRNFLDRCQETGIEPTFSEKKKVTSSTDEILQLVRTVVEEMPAKDGQIFKEALDDEEAVAELKDWLRAHSGSTISIADLLTVLFKRKLVPSAIKEQFQHAEETRNRFYFAREQAALAEAVTIWTSILALPNFSDLSEQFRLDVLKCAGADFVQFFNNTQDQEYLDKGIALVQQAVELTPPGNHRLELLNNLGVALRNRFILTGELNDLRSAIDTYDRAIGLNPERSLQAVLLSNLGRALTKLYEATRDLTTLERAIMALQQSVELSDDDDKEGLGLRLIKLGMASRHFYESSGELAYLDQAIECYERVHRSISPKNWGNFPTFHSTCLDLIERYNQRGDLQDLKRTIEICEHILSLPELDPASPTSRIDFLGLLGTALESLHTRTADPAVLESAIVAYQEALDGSEPGSAEESGALNSLSNALRHRYERFGNRADLDRAIQVGQRAVELEPRQTQRWGLYLNNLGISLMARYDLDGARTDLEFCINAWEETAKIIAPTSTDGIAVLLNLAGSLRSRYHLTSNLTDLTRVVDTYRRALNATPQDAHDRGLFLSNMANALRDYYVRTGDLSYLDEAIEYHRQSVTPMETNGGDRADFLINLGGGLLQRYESVGELSDLEEAIEVCQRLLELSPKNTRIYGPALANLGGALLKRYSDHKDEADLDLAISSLRQAVEIVPEGSPRNSLIVQNLGIALLNRFKISNAPDDLKEARWAIEQAITLVPADSVNWLGIVSNLGVLMSESHESSGDERDLERAIECFRQVCKKGLNHDARVVLKSCEGWLKGASKRRAWEEVIDIYGYGSQAIEYLFRTQLIRAGREVWLQKLGQLPSFAAYAFTALGKPEEAVLALETGRARLLADSLERARADLKMLPDRGHGELYERYSSAASRLAELERVQLPQNSLMFDQATLEDLRAARRDLDDAIAEIQQIPEYESFFRVQTWSQIQRSLTTPAAGNSVQAVGVYLSVTSAGGLALVVHPDGVEAILLPLDQMVLGDLLVEPEVGYLLSQVEVRWFKESLNKLLPLIGEKVMGPLAKALRRLWPDASSTDEKPVVTIIPGGLFALLPLHAARYTIDGVEQIFLNEFNVSYAPSAKVLAEVETIVHSSEQTLFGVGNPLPLPDIYEPLAFSNAEVKQISRFFDSESEILFETQATREMVQSKLGTAKYMHFSCHGYFDISNPLASGLVLSGGDLLTLSDLFSGRDLHRTRLTVLSACQTAVTDYGPMREESVGLASGFLHAGVPGVIGSLWPVNDLSTTLLMFKFYEYHLGTGSSKKPLSLARALRLAQLWLRDVTNSELADIFLRFEQTAPEALDPSYLIARERFRAHALHKKTERPFAHPFYWAPFVLYGV